MGTVTPFPLQIVQSAFPRFSVIREIRSGGQGAVFEAVRSQDASATACNDHVALKLYFDPSQTDRVLREINALRGYDHPNLSRLIEHGSVGCNGRDINYVAWEYVEGSPLDLRIASGPVNPKIVAVIGRDVARAVAHIWHKRIVHRDIKPNNVIVKTGDTEAILIDLGVARHLNEKTITGPGLVWGTIGYYSPEQYRAEKNLTCNSDMFSLAVVLLECLSGHHPTGRDQVALVNSTPSTASLVPACPAALAMVVDSMLHPRAAFRPSPATLVQRFADLAQVL
jgi:eukaryotic-like serine/threonine-protein kinase